MSKNTETNKSGYFYNFNINIKSFELKHRIMRYKKYIIYCYFRNIHTYVCIHFSGQALNGFNYLIFTSYSGGKINTIKKYASMFRKSQLCFYARYHLNNPDQHDVIHNFLIH